jgi:hypothetical protein
MRKYSDEQLDKDVLHLLKQHQGQEHPLGRWETVARLFGPAAAYPQTDDNLYDRQIRESVARLRRRGVLVCDMGDGRGRFLAANLAEYDAFRAYYGSGIFERMETIREMDDAARREFPDELQPRLL